MLSRLSAGWHQVRLLAEVIRGGLQPGLKKIVLRVVVKHLLNNLEFRTHRYPRLLRLSRWAVLNPLFALLIVAVPYLAVGLLASFDGLDSFGLADGKQGNTRDFWTVNIGVLTVQAALLGLVFPLVIAFVGLLNRGRASFASRLTIYIESTSAVFVGVSSLLLCVAISMQLPIAARIDEEGTTAVLTVLNLAWFTTNTGALAYFVLKTIAFLHPARRAPIIRAHASNVVWPAELTATVTNNRWVNVAAYGYLPAGAENDPFAEGGKARVWYSAMWHGGEGRVIRQLGRKMRLVDVRLGMLAPVVQDWLSTARKFHSDEIHDIVIPLQPGLEYEGNRALIRTTLPLSPVARWAIRLAFKFKKFPSEEGTVSETSQILQEMIADLIALIDTRQANEFSDQILEVIEFHAFLYLLAQSSDEDLNYAQLGNGRRIFGIALSEQWAHTYRDMFRRAVERLPVEPEFIRPIAYTPANIYKRVSKQVTAEALKPLLQLSESLTYRMIDWALGEYRAATGSEPDDEQAFTLLTHRDTYTRAWREQVAAWEYLLEVIIATPSSRERSGRSWNDLQRNSENTMEHLRATSRMVARAVRLGDTIATNWTCDLMLHWRTKTERKWARCTDWRLQSEALTLEMLQLDWVAVQDMPLKPGGDSHTAPAVFGVIMENAWQDHVLALASICIHWAIHTPANGAGKQAASMLLRGEHHDSGDTGVHEGNGFSGMGILISALRVTGSGAQSLEDSYAGRIDHLLESLANMGDRSWISGRIYSSDGGLSYKSLAEAQAIAIMATTPRSQAINGSLRRLLTQACDKALRRREDYLKRLLDAFDNLDVQIFRGLLSELVGSGDASTFEARKDHGRQLVAQSLDVLTGHRSKAIVEAAVDPERIAQVAGAAGSEAFTSNLFPLNLFDQVDSTTDKLEEFTLRVSGLSKGAYTDPPMAQAVLNEEDWWRDAVSTKVASVVWLDVLSKAHLQEIEGRTPDGFWSAVREGSKKIRDSGNDPILVVGNPHIPEWLSEWRWPHQPSRTPKPKDLIIKTEDRGDDSYEFTMNDTPVYITQTAFGVAYLIPAQLLFRLRYHEYDEGQPVFLRFELDAENSWSGTMNASFQRDVRLGDVEGFLIRWTHSSSDG